MYSDAVTVLQHVPLCRSKISSSRDRTIKVEEEEDYKLWPANKSDRSWQSLSNPAKRHSFVSN